MATYSEVLSRYDILVLRAGSKSGKTQYALSLYERVWEQLIEDLPVPNFRSFNTDEHQAILLDNVNSAQFILDNRGLLMARNVVHQLSQTATGLYTYPCYLHRVPIMITMDLEKPWPRSNWLDANCVVVERMAGQKFFATGQSNGGPSQASSSTDPPHSQSAQGKEGNSASASSSARPAKRSPPGPNPFMLMHDLARAKGWEFSHTTEDSGMQRGDRFRSTILMGGGRYVGAWQATKKLSLRAAAVPACMELL